MARDGDRIGGDTGSHRFAEDLGVKVAKGGVYKDQDTVGGLRKVEDRVWGVAVGDEEYLQTQTGKVSGRMEKRRERNFRSATQRRAYLPSKNEHGDEIEEEVVVALCEEADHDVL